MTNVLPQPSTSKKARATYASLIDAVRAVARDTGALAPEAIAERASVSPATFYTYFSSKDEALAAAFDVVLSDLHNQVRDGLNVEQLLETGLESVIRDTVRVVVRGFAHDARVFRLAISRLPESELIQEVYRQHEVQVLEHLARFIRLAQSAAKVRDTDPDRLARVLLIVLQGLQNPLLQQPGASPLADEIAAMVVGLLRHC